jgi:hypothetical protein
MELAVAEVEEELEADEVAGVDGRGLTVATDRALSVLELVIELKREVASFLVMVTTRAHRPEPFELAGDQDMALLGRLWNVFC